MVIFSADGLVIREQNTVSVPYPARVVSVDVEVGDRVGAGEPVARVESLTIRETIAQISLAIAELERERSQLQARAVEIGALLPIARRRAARMEALLDQNTEAYERGLTTSVNRSVLIEDEFDAAEKVAELRAERDETDRQIALLDRQRTELEARRALFAEAYDDGVVRAPVDGQVFDIAATVGGVVRAADPILTTVGGKPHILAYVNPGSLAEMPVGSQVKIEYGVRELTGTITRIFSLSRRLPEEFQRQFRPQERSQLIRIDFAEGSSLPPTFTKVEIASADHLPSWAKRLFGEEKMSTPGPASAEAPAEETAAGGRPGAALSSESAAKLPDPPVPEASPAQEHDAASDTPTGLASSATLEESRARDEMLAQVLPADPAKLLRKNAFLHGWRAQVGAFESRVRAETASRRLNAAHGPFEDRTVRIIDDAGAETTAARFRVQLGPFASQASAAAYCDRLRNTGQPCIPVPPAGT